MEGIWVQKQPAVPFYRSHASYCLLPSLTSCYSAELVELPSGLDGDACCAESEPCGQGSELEQADRNGCRRFDLRQYFQLAVADVVGLTVVAEARAVNLDDTLGVGSVSTNRFKHMIN